MTLPWFRLYHRTIDDDKLRLLAFEDRWHFIALCCLKADGLLDEPDSDIRTRRIAVKMGVQLRELDEIGRRLREVNLVDENLIPLAWDELQYKSDNSTARVQEYRKRQQKQPRNKLKRSRNVTVTAQEADTETDTELEANASRASGDALTAQHVFETWNEGAPRWGKSRVRDLTPERKKLIDARIAQHGLDGWREVFGNFDKSDFLQTAKGIQFDWVIQKRNFQKIYEGNYNG